MIAIGGLASVLALDPDLSGALYVICFAVTWGGLAGGLVAVTLIGISVASTALIGAKREDLEQLKKLGDRAAAEELLRKFDVW